MSDDPTGTEILILWRIALAGGGDWQKAIKPDLKGGLKERLLGSGLIEVDKKKPEGGGRQILYASLTDRGWQWLSEHLDTRIESKSPAAVGIFESLLGRLKDHLHAKDLSLAEFIHPASKDLDPSQDGLHHKIEAAYLSLSEGRANVRVRLSDLRDALPGIGREALDSTLLEMATSGQASLFRLDNPLEIGPRDREAILRTPSGEERHILYLGGHES